MESTLLSRVRDRADIKSVAAHRFGQGAAFVRKQNLADAGKRLADDCVPRTRKEELRRSSVRRMWCCTRDEGARPLAWWPFAAALQGDA